MALERPWPITVMPFTPRSGAGSIYMVLGRPGTGKTTFGNQLAFAHTKRGGRAVYVTLLAESHATMLKNLSGMDFFDPKAINDRLSYVGAYKALRDEGLRGLLDLIRQIVRDENATLLVIDGLSAANAVASNDLALKEFIVELQTMTSMLQCTTVLLSNIAVENAVAPEHTMVDGLIELRTRQTRDGVIREIDVIKFRGSDHFLGGQQFDMGTSGLVVHPRTEEVLRRRARPAAATSARAALGIPALDAMLGGGLRGGTTTMLFGFAGSGKSSLGLQFLHAGLGKKEPALYFGFYESPARLIRSAKRIGMDFEAPSSTGLVQLMWHQPWGNRLDELAENLLADVTARKVKRLVIDDLDGFWQSSADGERALSFTSAS